MIVFSNIAEQTQRTLFDKRNMLEKNEKVKGAGEPLSQENGDLKQNYMFSRSVFMRMISLQPPFKELKPIVLTGGEILPGGSITGDLFGGAEGVKVRTKKIMEFKASLMAPKTTIFDSITELQLKTPGKYYQSSEQTLRPMPGVKDISVEFAGGGRTTGATRVAEINWVCWSWPELDRLTKHFLHHGKTVFIDWGWSGVGDLNNIELFNVLDEEGNLIELAPGRDLLKELPEHVIKQDGNYDALIGIIQDFSWSVRDDGGFDCVTKLVAPGINILKQDISTASNPNLQSLGPMFKDISESSSKVVKEGMNVMEAPSKLGVAGMGPVLGLGYTQLKMLQAMYNNHKQGADPLTGNKQHTIIEPILDDDVQKRVGKTGEPATDHEAWMNRPGQEAEDATTVVDENRDNQWSWDFKGGEKFTMRYRTGHDMVSKYAPFLTFDMYMEDLPNQLFNNVRFDKNIMESGHIIRTIGVFGFGTEHSGIYKSKLSGEDKGTGYVSYNKKHAISYEFDEMYVTWGWFEDNVISRFFSKVETNIVLGQFRSIERIIEKSNDATEEESMRIEYIKIRNHPDLITTDFSKFLILRDENDPIYKTVENLWANPEKWEKEGDLDLWKPPMEKLHQIADFPDVDVTGFYPLLPHKPIKKDGKSVLHNFNDPDNPRDGILRNVYFNARYLKEKMSNVSSIEDAILAVWGGFSEEYGGLYNFYIDYADDMNTIQVRDQGWSKDAVKDLLENKSHEADPDGIDDEAKAEKMDGLFEFPTWEKSSMVISQNLEARIPDRMKLVAMYGTQNISQPDEGENMDIDDRTGLAWSRLIGNVDLREDGLTPEQVKAKTRESVLGGNIDYAYKDNLGFGQNTADINEDLVWGDIDGTKGGTIIHESILDELMKHEYDKYKEIIKETGQNSLPSTTDDEKKRNAIHNFYRSKFFQVAWGKPEKVGNLNEIYALFDGVAHESSNDVPMLSPFSKTHDITMNSVNKRFLINILKGKEGLFSTSDPLIPIDLDLEIDGTSAIFPGNAFQSSYIPSRYRSQACFQVKGVDHKVDSSGWTSTLRSQIRVSIPMQEEEGKELGDIPEDRLIVVEEGKAVNLEEAKQSKKKTPKKDEGSGEVSEQVIDDGAMESQEDTSVTQTIDLSGAPDDQSSNAQTPVIDPSVSIANIAIGVGGQATVDGQLLWKDEAMTDPVYDETLTAQLKNKPLDFEGLSKGDIKFQMNTSADGSLIKIGISENGVSAQQFTQMMPGIRSSIQSNLPVGANIDALMTNIYDNVTAPGSSGTTISIPTGGP